MNAISSSTAVAAELYAAAHVGVSRALALIAFSTRSKASTCACATSLRLLAGVSRRFFGKFFPATALKNFCTSSEVMANQSIQRDGFAAPDFCVRHMRASRLLELRECIGRPLFQAFPNALPVNSDLAEIEPTLFATLEDVEDDSLTQPIILGLLWATSKGAALRAFNSLIEADDGSAVQLPGYIFPAADVITYGALVSYLRSSDATCLESASYRVMLDGAFIHKSIQSRGCTFFFRGQSIDEQETPYAVLHSDRSSHAVILNHEAPV
jgi:hypothetical protein